MKALSMRKQRLVWYYGLKSHESGAQPHPVLYGVGMAHASFCG